MFVLLRAACSRKSRTVASCSFLLLLTGCISESTSDSVDRVSYSWWVPVVILLAGFACVPFGLMFLRSSARLGWGLMIVCPLAALMFAPSMFFEQVSVTDSGYKVRSGIWGMTANQEVNFGDASNLRIVEEMSTGRRRRAYNVFYFDMKTGGEPARLPLNNDVKVAAGPYIMRRAKAAGVNVPGIP